MSITWEVKDLEVEFEELFGSDFPRPRRSTAQVVEKEHKWFSTKTKVINCRSDNNGSWWNIDSLEDIDYSLGNYLDKRVEKLRRAKFLEIERQKNLAKGLREKEDENPTKIQADHPSEVCEDSESLTTGQFNPTSF